MGMKDPLDPAKKQVVKGRVSFHSSSGFRVWMTSVLGVSVVFAFQGQYSSLIGPLSNLLPTGAAAAAFGSALVCFIRYGHGIRRRFELVWFSFVLGTGFWVVAEATWAIYYFVLQVSVPYPSLADFFYIGGYFPMLAGLTLYIATFSVALSRSRLIFPVAAIGLAAFASIAFVLPIEIGQSLSLLNIVTDLTYPILDLALFSLAVLSLAIFIGGSIKTWWILMCAASVLYVVGDELFLYQVAQGTYYNGNLDDLIFIVGYLTFAFAFYIHRKEF